MIFLFHSVFIFLKILFCWALQKLFSEFKPKIAVLKLYSKKNHSFSSLSNHNHEISQAAKSTLLLQLVYHFQMISSHRLFAERFDNYQYKVPKSFNKSKRVFLIQTEKILELSLTFVFRFDNRMSVSWSTLSSQIKNLQDVLLNKIRLTFVILKALPIRPKNKTIF